MAEQNEKLILDLCGGTGSWSNPYRRGGYCVKVVTLPQYDIFDVVLAEDSREIILRAKDGIKERIAADAVYGILAAPTCTMFSLARTTARTPRNFAEGMALVEKCLRIVWFCRESNESNLHFWALENPVGYLRQFLGKPPLTFSPEEYGDTYSKRTDIWGYFKEPKRSARELTEEEKARAAINNRVLPELPEGYELPKDWNRQAARRSMTSAKFAEAFYKANR